MKNNKNTPVEQDAFLFPKKSLLTLAVAAAVSTMAAPAYSLSFEPTDEVTIDWDTTLNYTAAWRTSDQDDDLLANNNGDDGNRNFDKGSMINNRFTVLSEIDFKYRNVGAFVRGSAFYDDAYFGKNDHDRSSTANNQSVGYNEFTDETQDNHGKKARLLDAFVYGNFELGERNLNVRVGRQVVNWGESIFIGNIGLAMSPVDATKSNVAGVEVKDIYLPVGQVFAQLDLTENFNVSAYSQWEWEKTEINSAGSYFSTTDLIDEGGEYGYVPSPFMHSMSKVKNVDPSDNGQWGVALNYFAEGLGNGVELGLYYINYHEKNPVNIVRGQMVPDLAFGFTNTPFGAVPNKGYIPYHIEYYENIKLIGTSFGTLVGDTNIGGEIAYRKGTTVLEPGTQGPVAMRANTIQAQLSAIHSFGVTRIADDVILTAEIGYNEVVGKKNSEVNGERKGSGFAGQLLLKYNNVFPATNLEVPISFRHNIDGHSAAGTFTATGSNTDRVSVAAKLFYQNAWEAGITYNAYFGKAEDNQITDRDYVAMNVKYSF